MAAPSLETIRGQMATWLANTRASAYSVTDLVSEALHVFAAQYIDPLVQGAPGQANGVATLDGTGKVPTSQLPSAVVGALKFKGTWDAGTNTPALPGSPAQGDSYRVSAPGATNLSGITSWAVGDWAVYDGTNWSKIDNTDAVVSVNGATGAVVVASLSGGIVQEPVRKVQAGNDPGSPANGEIWVNAKALKYRDNDGSPATHTVQATDEKDQNNGYAGLDGSGNVIKPVLLVRSGVDPGTGAGSVTVNNGDLKYGDGANQRQVQGQHQKNQPNGYPGLDNNSKLDAGQIPAFTGTLSKDFDPASQQYNRNVITTLKTYDAGPGAHIMVTGFQLPPRGNANLKTRLLVKFSDNSSVFVENDTDAAKNGTAQDAANTIMGDAAAGQGANNDGKRVQSISFEVQNIDANNDYTVDLAAFRVRGYVVPRGGGTITTTPA